MSEQVTKLNMSQAARAANISRNTLYKKIKTGKLSKEQGADGNPMIDVSELMRVYPQLDMKAALETDSNSVQEVKPSTIEDTLDTALLEQEIKHLSEKLEGEQERRRQAEEREQRLLEIVEAQTRQLAAPKDELATPNPQKRGFWARLSGR